MTVVTRIVRYSFSKECKSGNMRLATGFPFITSQSVRMFVTLLIVFPVSSLCLTINLGVSLVELLGVPFENHFSNCSPISDHNFLATKTG